MPLYIAREQRCTSWTTCCPPTPTATFQTSLSESLGEVLPASGVFDYPTVEALVGYLATILPELIELGDQEKIDAYEGLTEDALLKELSERLD